ncbi:hypothetical protein [Levilactobacillus acidifarinae]|uniref:hypothetical protein n=1 Tax=Levilactobacillus acidifarinae TaxID=267364 RepID=UPI00070C8908|nr:hypothetical protein [Levilactobacillus acidifarinae]GEO70516.1 hypothetical protein LAC03_24260 [Levilactobacillus acidifarinae]
MRIEFKRLDKCRVSSKPTGQKRVDGTPVLASVFGMEEVLHVYDYEGDKTPTISASGVWLHAGCMSLNLNTIVPGSLKIRPEVELEVEK